jgi:lipid-A-disaccharide synthase
MKYYLIAGEASGDLHGSNLMKALKEHDEQAQFRIWGGELMQAQDGELIMHYRRLAFMGFVKVVTNFRTIYKNLALCKKDILEYQPDVVIFIDFAGFNLQVAKYVKSIGIKTVFYISPKIWAWKQNRVKKIKRYIDKMLTILPFETEFYNRFNYPVTYVGNPVLDAIHQHFKNEITSDSFKNENHLTEKPIIALLAGSRRQEIKLMLPVMLEVSRFYPDYQFVIAGAPGIEPDFYQKIIGGYPVPIVFNQTYNLVKFSKAALVTSGTATLETALIGTPQIVCYTTNIGTLLYKIGRKLIKVKWISLVNLILNFEAVKELIQNRFKKEYIIDELNRILYQETYRETMLQNYARLHEILGHPGASQRAAKSIIEFVKT